ncbi:MAG: orotidine-5'-phosphate decarboxylase [Patescibacteria group bacterium]|jgi:orotidine-5'-phosphate decarboxylase
MDIVKKLNERMDKANSLLSVGLDPDYEKLPERFKKMEFPQFEFNKYIMDATHEYAAVFKPNNAFYEERGDKGLRELKMTMDYAREKYPDVFLIVDCKRGDIGNTNKGYLKATYDWLGADGLTMSPYMGKESLQCLLDRKDKACIILVRTSNPGAGEFQDLLVGDPSLTLPLARGGEKPLWQIVAENVVNKWNEHGNCMMVMGVTWPEEMKKAREIAGDMTFLCPGFGPQGGDLGEWIIAGLSSEKKGLIINSSRAIIFSDDPKEEARKLRDEINKYR